MTELKERIAEAERAAAELARLQQAAEDLPRLRAEQAAQERADRARAELAAADKAARQALETYRERLGPFRARFAGFVTLRTAWCAPGILRARNG